MRVRMLSTAAGPAGVWPAGSIQDLPDEQGRALMAAGAAEAATPAAVPEPASGPTEPPAKKKGNRGRH